MRVKIPIVSSFSFFSHCPMKDFPRVAAMPRMLLFFLGAFTLSVSLMAFQNSLASERALEGGSISFNFQPPGATVPSGYERASTEAYSAALGYGWDGSVTARVRLTHPDPVLDSLVYASVNTQRTWSYDVENGTYLVSLRSGDPRYGHGPQLISIEGETVIDVPVLNANDFLEVNEHEVVVSDGQLNITIGDSNGGGNNFLNTITISESTGGGSGGEEPDTSWSVVTDGLAYITGKVGIGTDTPEETLHVEGNLKVNGVITSDGDICIGNCQ